MQVEVDKFGRLIIPSAVRQHLGIKAGSVLELFEKDHAILLTLVNQKPPLQRKKGILVYTGEATNDIDDAIKKDREDRLKGFLE